MITHYCIIRDRQFILDGKPVFFPGNSLEDFLTNAYQQLAMAYPKFFKMDNLSKLGVLASEVLFNAGGVGQAPFETAIVLSNSQSSLDTDRKFHNSSKTVASPALFVYTLPNIVAGEICIRHKIKGENIFFVTDRFDSSLVFDNALLALDNGAEICLAGWVDVSEEQHDVFLYLLDKGSQDGMDHSPASLDKLYNSTYGQPNA